MLRSNESYDEAEGLEKYAREVFKYEYLIVGERNRGHHKVFINAYMKNSHLEKVASFKSSHSTISNYIASLGFYDLSAQGYDGTIYKRIEE